jgi:hypothetical protein
MTLLRLTSGLHCEGAITVLNTETNVVLKKNKLQLFLVAFRHKYFCQKDSLLKEITV